MPMKMQIAVFFRSLWRTQIHTHPQTQRHENKLHSHVEYNGRVRKMDLNIRRNNELISILNLGDERKIEFRTNSASYTQRDIKLAATRTAPAPKVIWTSKGNVKTKSKTCLQCNWITRRGRLMQTYHIHTSTTPHALVPVWKHHIHTPCWSLGVNNTENDI